MFDGLKGAVPLFISEKVAKPNLVIGRGTFGRIGDLNGAPGMTDG